MKLAFGCDHAGYEAPEPYYAPEIIRYLESLGHTVEHVGTFGPDSVDYPDFAAKVCARILDGSAELGVLLCGTGMGISIAANRHRGIRAAACVTEQMVKLARDHSFWRLVSAAANAISGGLTNSTASADIPGRVSLPGRFYRSK
jgi:ribose 5-phosphate isomerase B